MDSKSNGLLLRHLSKVPPSYILYLQTEKLVTASFFPSLPPFPPPSIISQPEMDTISLQLPYALFSLYCWEVSLRAQVYMDGVRNNYKQILLG